MSLPNSVPIICKIIRGVMSLFNIFDHSSSFSSLHFLDSSVIPSNFSRFQLNIMDAISFTGLAKESILKLYFFSNIFATVLLPDPFNPIKPIIIIVL